MKEYAGFWLRFVAYIIDYILIWVVQAFIAIPILGMVGISFASRAGDMSTMDEGEMLGMFAGIMAAAGATALLTTILVILYFTLMESSKYQATVGKLALGLIVTDENGEKLDMVKALIRNLSKILSSMILLIGYIMVGFTEKKQGLHDIIAKTLVVKK
ncbi:MAG TPA: RDD family protein [Cytophagales bacterium]|nr:RDD family protein [Cytophagales bacterium]HCR54919.1 RDD family protein [Cytophagales bacterium]